MNRTARFREQHTEILADAKELRSLLNAAALSKDAGAARTCLGRMIGKLKVHLNAEDSVLYPELAAHKDPAMSNLAKRFSQEMLGVSKTVMDYNGRWMLPSKIAHDPAAFIDETQKVLSVLVDRMRRENQELYAAADRIEGAAFT